jgi:hypothetical protein
MRSATASATSTVSEMPAIPISTSARLPQSLANQISAPSPVCAATIFAEITHDHEIARVTFSRWLPTRFP